MAALDRAEALGTRAWEARMAADRSARCGARGEADIAAASARRADLPPELVAANARLLAADQGRAGRARSGG